MNVVPDCVWSSLFPADATFGPADPATSRLAGIEALLSQRGGPLPGVRLFGRARLSDRDLAGVDAAAIFNCARFNCTGVTDAALHEAGFTHVRRYAVLPSLERPRWFIPIASPAVTAASLNLCQPTKPSARLKRRIAQLAARSGIRMWYRDHLCIAQRQASPLESAISECVGRPVLLAFSTGSPPPTLNRKAALAAVDSTGTVVAYGKLPGNAVAAVESVKREAAGLRQVALHFPDVLAPKVLMAGVINGTFMTLASPLAGRPAGTALTARHREFLRRLQRDDARVASASGFVRNLLASPVASLLQPFLPQLQQLRLPTTLVHGDFAPWNLRIQGDRLAAFDWEYAEPDGLPLIDEIHHLLAVGYLLNQWTAADARARLLAHEHEPRAGYSPADVRAVQAAYLVDYLARLNREGYTADYKRFAWCRDILAGLTAAVRRAA